MTKRINKPWGYELIWAHTDKYVGKILHIDRDHSLSLQYHEQKAETIYVHVGKIRLHLDGNEFIIGPGQSVDIKPGIIHRMTAIEETEIFEVSTSELDDVVRLEDNYGRLEKK